MSKLKKRDMEKLWREGRELIPARNFDAYVKGLGLDKVRGAFELRDRKLRCIDEGTPGGVHLAGSGILLEFEEAERIAREAGVTAVTSHRDCGAARLSATMIGIPSPDDKGRTFSEKLASALGVGYEEAKLERPDDLHVAMGVYIDGTGSFDPTHVKELPRGFVISRSYLPSDYARREIELVFDIARHHGFGHKFDNAHPFLVIPVARDTNQYIDLAAEAQLIAGSRRWVKVDGFVRPQ